MRSRHDHWEYERVSARWIVRQCRRMLYRELAPAWRGTRESLKRAIRKFIKPYRKRLTLLWRIARDARFAALAAGAVLAAHGGSAWAGPPIDAGDVAAGMGGFVINGANAYDQSGFDVFRAGDVNGDGVPDLIVGAPYADPGGNNAAGESYVVFGKSGGAAVELSSVAAGVGGFAISGETDTYSGWSVAGAGDVNGDGLADLLVGAPYADLGGQYIGQSFVVFGKADGAAVNLADVAAGMGGFVVNGFAENGRVGIGLSDAGDVNGDGLADLALGAPGTDMSPNLDVGQSYVVFGKTDTAAVQLSDIADGAGADGFAINGIGVFDRSGFSVSGAEDVNGDGLSDLLVGAPGPRGPTSSYYGGESFVVFGKADAANVDLSAIADGIGSDGFVIDKIEGDDVSGYAVSGAGDVNGDGFADLLVGAPYAEPGGRAGAGQSYVVFGKPDAAPVNLSDVASGIGGFAISGEADAYSGWSVSGAGDVNGDGLSDLLIGVPYANLGSYYVGQSYVVMGKTDGAEVDLADVAGGTGGFVVNGIDENDRFGVSVSDAGDVNGDGQNDLIVGARAADPKGVDSAGESYVIFSPEVPPLAPPVGVPSSAIYLARTRAGDGPGGAPVVPTRVGHSRATIDYGDDDAGDNGAGGASTETVALTRTNAGIGNLNSAFVAKVVWEISTDRVGWNSAEVALKFLELEVADLSGTTRAPTGSIPDLRIFTAPSLLGPWTEQTTVLDAARNTARATVSEFGFFALASSQENSADPEIWSRLE